MLHNQGKYDEIETIHQLMLEPKTKAFRIENLSTFDIMNILATKENRDYLVASNISISTSGLLDSATW